MRDFDLITALVGGVSENDSDTVDCYARPVLPASTEQLKKLLDKPLDIR